MTRHSPNHIILRSFPGRILLWGQDDKIIWFSYRLKRNIIGFILSHASCPACEGSENGMLFPYHSDSAPAREEPEECGVVICRTNDTSSRSHFQKSTGNPMLFEIKFCINRLIGLVFVVTNYSVYIFIYFSSPLPEDSKNLPLKKFSFPRGVAISRNITHPSGQTTVLVYLPSPPTFVRSPPARTASINGKRIVIVFEQIPCPSLFTGQP